jgi:hypothetical protein
MNDSNFRDLRRQAFLSEESYLNTLRHYADGETQYRADLVVLDVTPKNRQTMLSVIADGRLRSFQLRHTAGEPFAELANLLTIVVEGFEDSLEASTEVPDDEYDPAFPLPEVIDVYINYLHILCVAILLRREDLIPRIHAMIEGTDYDKEDGVIERLLSFYLPDRPTVNEVYWEQPYGQLLDALDAETSVERAGKMKKYVKNWYKNMKGQAGFWGKHERIKRAFTPYFGYWAMCAGAFSFLYDIDDSGYRDDLVYPKDLVAYARRAPRFSLEPPAPPPGGLRVEGGQPCPQTGYWATPAQQDSRRLFKAGELMPVFEHSAYGATIWQWSEEQ